MTTTAAINQIRKKFGATALFYSRDKPQAIDAISTGSLALDKATGIGGIPVSRISEIVGPESSGKSTICLRVVANAQEKFSDKHMCYVDMEHALDLAYAEKLGVDLARMMIAQPDTGEEALEIVESLLASKEIPVIIVDSVATLVPRKIREGEVGDAEMGALARLMSSALKKLNPLVSESGTALFFTNQMRQKIGVMFGSPDTTPGGLSLPYYASLRIKLYSRNNLEKKTVTGIHTIATVIKNKLAVPYRKAEFDVVHGVGIDRLDEVVVIGAATGVLARAGASFSFGDTKLGVGKETVKAFLKENPALAREIETEILSSNYVSLVSEDGLQE